MSGEDFTDRYQLLKKLTETRVSTYLARAANGDRVMVHFLPGGDRATRSLLQRLDQLSEPARSRIRDSERAEDGPVIVTDYLKDFESFDEWVSRSAAPGSPPPPDAPGEEPVALSTPEGGRRPEAGGEESGGGESGGDGPGEFTRLFEAPEAMDEEPTPEEESAPGSADRGDEGGEPSRPDAGEPPSTPESDRPSPEAGSGPAEGSDADEEAGEFTRLFEAPEATDEEPTPEEESASGAVPPPESEPPPPPERSEASPPPREESSAETGGDEPDSGEGPGEFTRMFGSPEPPGDDDVSRLGGRRGSEPASGGGGSSGGGDGLDYLERLSPDPGPGTSGSDAPRRSDPPPRRDDDQGARGGSRSSGPSEYTRIIEGGRAPGTGSVGGAVPAPDAGGGAGRGSSGSSPAPSAGGGSGTAVDEEPARWPWILGLVGVFLAAVGLVLYLVLSGGDGSEQEETGQDGEVTVTEGLRAPPRPAGAADRSVELPSGALRLAAVPQSSAGRTTRSSSSGDGKSEGT